MIPFLRTLPLLILPVFQANAMLCDAPSTILNGGFEDPDVTQPTPAALQTFGGNPVVKIYNQNDVPGWETTAGDGRIELWQSGFGGVISYEGNQHAEINANGFGAFFQDFVTVPGTTISWEFAHRGRNGTDTIELLIGAPGSTVSQGTFSTGNAAWDVKQGSYTVPLGQTITRFEYLAVSTASGNATIGNFIDAVSYGTVCDYGDAPASYPVTAANNGAAHVQNPTDFLGTAIDNDNDGQASANADGDDLNNVNDEDGVIFNPSVLGNALYIDRVNQMEVVANTDGFINAWIDFNLNGTWEVAEQILSDEAVVTGTSTLAFTIPATAINGTSYARIRYTSDNPMGALSFDGEWLNGEVEDYQVTLENIPQESTVWHFDEYRWTGENGEVIDSGTAGLNATATNGPTIQFFNRAISGNSGTCNYADFDGTDDVVTIGNPAQLDFDSPPDTLTIMAWVRPDEFAGRDYIVARGLSGAGGNRREIALQTRGNRFELQQRIGANRVRATINSSAADIGVWTHIAAVFDGTQWLLYKDGSLGDTATTTGPQTGPDSNWAIGGRHPTNGTGQFFNGAIDEVRIFNAALTATEVQFYSSERHVCPQPSLEVQKTVETETDPINIGLNPKAIPDSTLIYTIRITNTGNGANDPGTLFISDTLAPETTLFTGNFSGNGPFELIEGGIPSGVQLDYVNTSDITDDVVFLNSSNNSISPNGTFDETVRSFRIEFDEPMAPNGSSFEIRYRVRLEE